MITNYYEFLIFDYFVTIIKFNNYMISKSDYLISISMGAIMFLFDIPLEVAYQCVAFINDSK
jgi:hypothetical protein